MSFDEQPEEDHMECKAAYETARSELMDSIHEYALAIEEIKGLQRDLEDTQASWLTDIIETAHELALAIEEIRCTKSVLASHERILAPNGNTLMLSVEDVKNWLCDIDKDHGLALALDRIKQLEHQAKYELIDFDHEHAMALDALLAVEDGGDTNDSQLYGPCPDCGGERGIPKSLAGENGHREDCRLAEALRVAGFPVKYRKEVA